VLPEGVDEDHLRDHRDDLAAYVARDVAVGWVGFDRPWSEVREPVLAIARELVEKLLTVAREDPGPETLIFDQEPPRDELRAALARGADVRIRGEHTMRVTAGADEDDLCYSYLSPEEETSPTEGFSADVVLKGGERLEFPRPVVVSESDPTWATILAELERGADVTLEAGSYKTPFRVEICHQPEGSNHFPDPADAARTPRIQIAWSCPKPTLASCGRMLGDVGGDVLLRAGAVSGNLGGISFTARRDDRLSYFATSYECLLGTRQRAAETAWLRSHARGAGHRVLVPAAVSAMLPEERHTERTTLAHGVLLAAAGSDPFTYDPEPMEREVRRLVGSPKDAAHG
jgi:hypothetical protein